MDLPNLGWDPSQSLHEHHEEAMDYAEHAIVDPRRLALDKLEAPLQSDHAKEVRGRPGDEGEGDALLVREGSLTGRSHIEHATQPLETKIYHKLVLI